MILTRIRSYRQNGEFTGADHLYLGNDHVKAINRFRKEYPEHDDCIVIAETYDSEQNADHYKACWNCGCIH